MKTQGYASKAKVNINLRRSLLTTGILISAYGYSTAAIAAIDDDVSIEELRSEILRLRQENATLKSGKPSATTNSPTALNSTAVAATEPPKAQAEAGETKSLGAVRVSGRRLKPLEALKETPKSISIVTGDELQRFEVTRFQDVVKNLATSGLRGRRGWLPARISQFAASDFLAAAPKIPASAPM